MKQLLIVFFITFSIAAQEAKFEFFENLPNELKVEVLRHKILPLIRPAHGILNVRALERELQNLAILDKKMRAIVNDPRFMLAILKSLPRAAAVILAKGLANMPGIRSVEVQEWLKNIKLVRGEELFSAVAADDLKKVADILKDPNIDVNWNTHTGFSALLKAAHKGNTEIVRLLLIAGAHVNKQDNGEKTALILAALFGHTEIVRLLLAAGANANIQDNCKSTALMLAAGNGCREIVRLLLAAGADLTIINQSGNSARNLALQMDHNDIIKILDDAIKARKK